MRVGRGPRRRFAGSAGSGPGAILAALLAALLAGSLAACGSPLSGTSGSRSAPRSATLAASPAASTPAVAQVGATATPIGTDPRSTASAGGWGSPSTSAPAATATPSPSGPTPSSSPGSTPSSVPAQPSLSPSTARALSATFTAAARRLGVPGVQATVLFADGQTWQGAYGYADLKTRRAITSADVFDVGSITKTFVAAEVLELVAAGRLGLDDHLSEWLAGLPDANQITIRQLLSHTSGLADYLENPKLLRAIDAEPARRWTPGQLLAYIGRPLFRPGSDWRYSNSNFLVLGIIAATVEGRPLAKALEDRFLVPLELGRTALQSPTVSAAASVGGPAALPYARTGGSKTAVVSLSDGSAYLPYASLGTALSTAGALISDSTDLARWAAALYGGQVLPPTLLATMTDDAVSKPFHPDRDYALGTELKRLAGLATLGHSGACSGYRSAMRYVPALGATVVVLVNEEVLDPDTVTTALIATLQRLGPGSGRAV